MMTNVDYGTQDVAKLCGVYRSTVIRWIESQKIKGLRTPGGHYRVTQESLKEFLRRYQYQSPSEIEPSLPKVLVVDDDSDVLEMVCTALKRELGPHAHFEGFDSGYQALVHVGKEAPDVAIVDVFMAKVDGYELCEAIRKSDGGEGVQLIMMTGKDSPEFRERAKALSAICVIKPLDLRSLVDRVGDLLHIDAVQG